MKRKVSSDDHSQMSAVSAIAARRAKAQAQAQSQTQPESASQTRELRSRGTRATARLSAASSNEEPPLKKAKPSSSKTSRNLRSKQDETTTSRRTRSQEAIERSSSSSSSVTSDVDEDTSIVEAEFETQDEPWDGLETSVLDDGGNASTPSTPKAAFERENFLLSRARLRKADILYTTSESVCIRLKLKSTLAVIGQYDLWVKRGVISISGAKLHPSPRLYRVYAPSTHSLPIIKSVSTFGDYAEIELRSIDNTNGPYGLNKLSPLYDRIKSSKDLPKGNSLRGHGPYSFSILHSSSEDSFGRSLRPMHMDKKWSRAIQELSKRSASLRVMACGPKGAGKSTFNTFLVNHLLSPPPSADSFEAESDGVAFLDLDPGQPEFSPMGHIYLAHLRQPILGPPFTHPAGGFHKGEPIIKKATFIGSSSPKDNPDYYVAATMDLIEHYRVLLQSYPRCALVVNYPGWIFGFGLEIAILFLRSLGLTDLVYMSEKGPAEVIEPLAYAAQESNIKTTILPSQPTDYVSRSSSQLRIMQMMSYFHISQDEGDDASWSNNPLVESRPMVVSYIGDNKGVMGIVITGSGHDTDFLKELLEGSLVGMVAVEDISSSFPSDGVSDDHDSAELIQLNKDGIPYISAPSRCDGGLNPTSSQSLGLALVHSIDIAKGQLILYTPTPISRIRSVIKQGHHIVLVKGQIDSPNWAISEAYFAARAAQSKHRRMMALAKGVNVDNNDDSAGEDDGDDAVAPATTEAGNPSSTSHHELSVKSMLLRDQVRLAGHVPWMTVSMNDTSGGGGSDGKDMEGRNKMFRLRKKPNTTSGAGESDAEW